MILAVPNPHSVEFIDLTDQPNLFKDLDKLFIRNSIEDSRARSFSRRFCAPEVVDVGSYQASIALNIDQLRQCDEIFGIRQGCLDFLQASYPSTMGFVVCRLRTGTERYHPFAYSSEHDGNAIFVPTLHYHEGEQNGSVSHDWNHDIFLYDVQPALPLRGYQSGDEFRFKDKWRHSGLAVKEDLIEALHLSSNLQNFTKFELTGTHLNDDIVVPIL